VPTFTRWPPRGSAASHLLGLLANDMRVTMTLIGAKSIHEITRDNLAHVETELTSLARASHK